MSQNEHNDALYEPKPAASVPVLYPLYFKPLDENGQQVITDCFARAGKALLQAVVEAGWSPTQGVCKHAGRLVRGKEVKRKVPLVVGFFPLKGEKPGDPQDRAGIEMLKTMEAYAVAMRDEDGELDLCATKEDGVVLIYEDSEKAFARSMTRDDARVIPCFVGWDPRFDPKRKRSV